MYVYFTTDQASTVSYTVSAEGYPDYTANAITSDEAAAAYREAAAGDADGSGNVGGTSTASQTTTVSSNDIASTEHEFLVLGLIPKVKNTITLTITDTDGNLKAQYKMVLSSGCICRVYQYGFRGFYFA
nr:aryl-sulfate sulfotransferase N-terminal domain-containing protein [Bifidobacterium longum]